jgi:ribonuclease BN (tRNA processing enzyme)
MAGVKVVFLGTGDAFSARGGHQAAYRVDAGSSAFLLDCGSSTLTAMKRECIDAANIDLILLSHLHGDHFAGLPYMFLEYTYELHRDRPLTIAGPPGTEERVLKLYSAAYKELAARPMCFEVRYIELQPGETTEIGAVSIEPFRVPHQEKEISLGLVVGVGGRKIFYSGDTGWTEELVTRSQGTDLFICECCFYETRVDFHLDYPRLHENRHRFGCKRMVLTHLGREVQAHRDDVEIDLAYDGMVVEL